MDIFKLLDLIREDALLVSLSLTITSLIYFSVVMIVWGRRSVLAFFTRNKSSWQWITLGVFLSFGSKFGDSGYWAFPWSAQHYRWLAEQALFDNGVFSNIFFRNFLGLASAYCHLRGIWEIEDLPYRITRGLGIAAFFGTLSFLVITKPPPLTNEEAKQIRDKTCVKANDSYRLLFPLTKEDSYEF